MGTWFRRNWGWIPLFVLSPLLFATPAGLWAFFPLTVWYLAVDIPNRPTRRDMRRASRQGISDEELDAWLNQ